MTSDKAKTRNITNDLNDTITTLVPSKVLVINNLDCNVKEDKLNEFFIKYGKIIKIILRTIKTLQCKDKINQNLAFIEMETLDSSINAYNELYTNPLLFSSLLPNIKNLTNISMYPSVKYTNFNNINELIKELSCLLTNNQFILSNNSGRQNNLPLNKSYDVQTEFCKNTPSTSSTPSISTKNERNEQGRNKILLMTIQNPRHVITTDVLYSFFNYLPEVTVEKIVIFVKSAGLQALVQFKTADEATRIKKKYEGKYLYANEASCALIINYSNLSELTIKENGLRTKDYTDSSLPAPQNDRAIDCSTNSRSYNYSYPCNYHQAVIPTNILEESINNPRERIASNGHIQHQQLYLNAQSLVLNNSAYVNCTDTIGSNTTSKGLLPSDFRAHKVSYEKNSSIHHCIPLPIYNLYSSIPVYNHSQVLQGTHNARIYPNGHHDQDSEIHLQSTCSTQNLLSERATGLLTPPFNCNCNYSLPLYNCYESFVLGSKQQSTTSNTNGFNVRAQQQNDSKSSSVLLISNLNECATCDNLFNLFSFYGTIICIKKLLKKGYALIQFVSNDMAKIAQTHLRGYELFGNTLDIRLSIHKYIQHNRQRTNTRYISEEDSDIPTKSARIDNSSGTTGDDTVVKEYAVSFNRFGGKQSFNSKRLVYSPTKVLHVSNISKDVTEKQLKEHIITFAKPTKNSIKLVKFRSTPGSTKSSEKACVSNSSGGTTTTNLKLQAFICFDKIEEATNCLARCHNTEIRGLSIKIAFSMTSIEQIIEDTDQK